jgi:hypothetical protein
MRKFLLLLFLFVKFSFAQDTLFLISGSKIICKVKAANNKRIRYTVDGNDSLRFSIPTRKLTHVKLQSGYNINQSILSSKHIYQNPISEAAQFAKENIQYTHILSFNPIRIFSDNIELAYTQLHPNKKYATYLSGNFLFSKTRNGRLRSNEYKTHLGFTIGLQIINYNIKRNSVFIMPALVYEYLSKRNSTYYNSFESSSNRYLTVTTSTTNYYHGISPCLFIGGNYFFNNRIFITPMFGFGPTIRLGKNKIDESLFQFKLNVGCKLK